MLLASGNGRFLGSLRACKRIDIIHWRQLAKAFKGK
jgi:hypothetical protein